MLTLATLPAVNPLTREEFGARLRELRVAKGLTQAQAAERCGDNGVAQNTWSQYENAVSMPEWPQGVEDCAAALDVEVGELLIPPSSIPPRRKPGRPRKPDVEE